MDSKSVEWQQRFEQIWAKGDYRRGSTAQRLVPILRQYIPNGIINDYGSGTGRAEIELLKSGNYTINMVDIASSALEEPVKALLGEKLTFTQASLWELPTDFPIADWGLSINVMMTVPPEKVDDIFQSIQRTCKNLFFECYDMNDQRLGFQMTTTVGDAAFWKSKLSQYWNCVDQIPSPESKRRYIFICTENRQPEGHFNGAKVIPTTVTPKQEKPYISAPQFKPVTIITPTGDRPLAFSLCQRWMEHQTVCPSQWIIVDDGINPMDTKNLPAYAKYIRRQRQSTDPNHTLTINMAVALPEIESPNILIMEDDEYYAPKYIETMLKKLESFEVVGIGWSKYYHLPTGGYELHKNMEHASLAQTGFRDSFLQIFASCVEKGMAKNWLDDQLWQRVQVSQQRSGPIPFEIFVDREEPLYVGIKGLPGRKGIGIGHNPTIYKKPHDTSRELLKTWIPKDYQVYLDILKGIS